MQPSDEIRQYCDKVKEQIRWKKAREEAVSEIENHISDQRDAYMKMGLEESSATEKAILQMGDAELIGAQLDKCYRPKPQWIMLALTAVLMVIGMLINLYVDSLPDSLNRFNISYYLAAAVIFAGCYFLDFSVLGKNPRAVYFLVLSVSWIIVLYASFYNSSINGRLYWFAGGFSVSLSYLALVFPLAYAMFIYSMKGRGIQGIMLCGIGYAAMAAVLILVPTAAGLFVFTVSAFVTLCFAVSRNWFKVDKKKAFSVILLPSLMVLAYGAYSVFSSNYRSMRLDVFFSPEKDITGSGCKYAYLRGIISEAKAIGQGGTPGMLEGVSYFEDTFLLSFIAHKLGIIALAAVVILGIAIFTAAICKSVKEKSVLGLFVSLSVILTVGMQMALAVFDSLGYGLFTGFEFPFVSYGKTSLIINSALMGFMLSVFRTGELCSDKFTGFAGFTGKDIFSFNDGKIIIDLNIKRKA